MFMNFDDLPEEIQQQIRDHHAFHQLQAENGRREFTDMMDSFTDEQCRFLYTMFDRCGEDGSKYAAYLSGMFSAMMVWKFQVFDKEMDEGLERLKEAGKKND